VSSLPTISTLIPAYNAAAFVGRAIESALAQTYPPLDIIVVDDGSKDNTSEVVARYPPPVRVIRQVNGGPAAARNRAAREARGEWFALLDADDSWLPEKLERQLEHTASPDIGIVFTRAAYDAVRRRQIPVRPSFDSLWESNCVGNSGVMIRRATFEAVGGFDEDRKLIGVEDYNLWLRVAAAGWGIVLCPGNLLIYAPGPESLTRNSERFARAELANVDAIGKKLGLDPARLRAKRLEIQGTYGAELFHHRELRAAREFLGEALAQDPSVKRLGWYVATFLPGSLLDIRRRLVR
jgi:glycosyltransferase involved in cell wall biosynthesis